MSTNPPSNKVAPQTTQQTNPQPQTPPKKEEDTKLKVQEKQSTSANNETANDAEIFKSMKRGNYTVHVLIEKVLELKKVGDENTIMLPMVSTTCFGKTLRTQKLKNEVFTYDFEENFYFSGIDKSPEEMDSEKVIIKVHNINDTNKLNYLGVYQFDMQRIYNSSKDHSLHNQWIGLFNYENEEACGINGFLRLSISVLHEGDPKVALAVTELTKNKANFLMPPQLRQNMSFNQLAFHFYGALNIPNMDQGILNFNTSDTKFMLQSTNKNCDAFIRVEYGEFVVETDVKETHINLVTWNQIIKIPIPEPRVSDKVFIKLFDKDTGSNELIGTFELNLEDVIQPYSTNSAVSANKNKAFKNKYENPTRINFYGSDPNHSGNSKVSELMDNNAEIGMMYKGTVVMKVQKIENHGKPIRSVENFVKSPSEDIYKKKTSWNFFLRVYNYYSFNEKTTDDEVQCKIYFNIGHLFYPAFGKFKNKTVSFSKANRDYIGLPFFYDTDSENIIELPDIFIYVFVKDTRVAYQRISCKDFFKLRKLTYLKLLPDVYNKSKSDLYKGGLLKFSLRIDLPNKKPQPNAAKLEDKSPNAAADPNKPGEPVKPEKPKVKMITVDQAVKSNTDYVTTDEDEEEREYRKKNKETKSKEQLEREAKKILKPYTVIFNIFQTKDLTIVDTKGTNDPYIEISFQNQDVRSKNTENTVNSVFNESIIFENVYLDPINLHTHPIFLLKVFDSNLMSSNKLIGFSYVSLCNFDYELDVMNKNKSKFIQLNHPRNCEQSSGEILMSMNIFSSPLIELREKYANLYSVCQETEKYCIELNAVALRDLKSTGYTNSKKPYLIFDLNSIDVKQTNGTPSLGVIKTVNTEYGNNPTINQIYKIEVDLPRIPNNIPSLNCSVEDIYLRYFKEKLGNFEINLSTCFFETQKNMEEIQKRFDAFVKLNQSGYSTGTSNLINEDSSPLKDNSHLLEGIIRTESNEDLGKKKSGKLNVNQLINSEADINLQQGEINIKIKDDKKESIDSRNSINSASKPEKNLDNNKDLINIKAISQLSKNIVERKRTQIDFTKENNAKVNDDDLKIIFALFCTHNEIDDLIFTKILDLLDIVTFSPFKELRHRISDNKGECAPIEDEVFDIPTKYYFKLGYEKVNSDKTTFISYRRLFDTSLEECKEFKAPFTAEEKKIILSRFGSNTNLARKILNLRAEPFKFKTPFRSEHLIRGKTTSDKAENSLFENIRDKSKFNFRIKNGVMIPDTTNKSNRYTVHNLSDAELQKMSKGQFKYLLRIYNYEMFRQHVERLEKAILLYDNEDSDKKTSNEYKEKVKEQIRKAKSNILIKRQSVIISDDNKSFDFEYMNTLISVLPEKFKFLIEHETLAKSILVKKEVIVRVYVISLEKLANRDEGLFEGGAQGISDPYVKIYLNNDDKDNVAQGTESEHLDDQKDVLWCKHYDFTAVMPGSGTLNIDVMDYDNAFSHDLIGRAVIDIESRFFDMSWQSLEEKPIERVPIYHDDFAEPQGEVTLWIDIFDKKDSKKRNNPVFIKPRPPAKMEVRLVIWECEGIQNMDMESSDIFFNATIDDQSQGTDVHFNSWKGTGSFNWRIVIPITYEEARNKEKIVNLQAYDYDIFSKNDFIAQKSFTIDKLLKECDKYDIPVKFDKNYFDNYKQRMEESLQNSELGGDLSEEQKKEMKESLKSLYDFIVFEDKEKFWIKLDKGMNRKLVDGVLVEEEKNGNSEDPQYPYGKVLCSLEVYPIKLAESCPVGKGRSEPNINPYLPPPVGRMQWSWNPYSLVCQFIPPKWRRKICMTICFLLCIAYLIFVIPYMILHISGEIVNPFNYIGKK